jgi:hypothetical protein
MSRLAKRHGKWCSDTLKLICILASCPSSSCTAVRVPTCRYDAKFVKKR